MPFAITKHNKFSLVGISPSGALGPDPQCYLGIFLTQCIASDVSWTLDVMKRNEHKDKELEFQHNMIRFVKLGDACHTFRGKIVIGGIVFYKHTYLVCPLFLLCYRIQLEILSPVSYEVMAIICFICYVLSLQWWVHFSQKFYDKPV